MSLQNYTGTTTTPDAMKISALSQGKGLYTLSSGTGTSAIYTNGSYQIKQNSNSKWAIFSGDTELDHSSDSASSPLQCSFNTATNTAVNVQTICTAASTKQIAIVSILLFNDAQWDTNYIGLHLSNSSGQQFSYAVSLTSKASLVLDHKYFVPAGYTLKLASAAADTKFSASASEDNL